MELLSKITMKAIGCQPKAHSVESAMVLATIYGIARGAKLGTTNFGEYLKFQGSFEAVCVESGEVFQSPFLILPKTIEGLLYNAVQEDNGEDGSGNGVQFGVQIGVKPSAAGNTGYEWTIKPIVKAAQNDALSKLRDEMKNLLPAPEPKKDAPKAPAKK